MAQRQDRDTFGVHQNRAVQNNSKRNSFSANWEVHSTLTQETTQDEGSSWAKDHEKVDGRTSRTSSWGQAESSINERKGLGLAERWDVEHKYERARNSTGQEPMERPTFRTHQFNKSAQQREKKLSVSTQNTDKMDKMEGEVEFY